MADARRRHCSLPAVALLAVALTVACGRDGGSPPADAPPEELPATEPAASTGSSGLISAEGIGAARRGLTFGELRAGLGPDRSLGAPGPYMVDQDGMPVVAGVDTLYLILVAAGIEPADDDALETVITSHPEFRTAEGIGPGTTLGDAAQRYGAPTLSYNVNDESREYASFPGYAADNVLFRVGPTSTGALAGSYATQGEANTTAIFDPEARIRFVLVGLR